jgi:hypothetical protein
MSLSRHRVALLLITAAMSLALLEVGLRAALKLSTSSWLANPGSTFDPLCDEDYWLALGRGRWAEELGRPGVHEQDPVLGWTPDRRSLDAQGAWPTVSRPSSVSARLAVFGDSYAFGTTPDGQRISDILQELRPDEQIMNFAVGGYGLDQTLLRLEDRQEVLTAGDRVVIGVLTTDLDRVILSVRDAPKPVFRLDGDGELRLQPPDGGDLDDWFNTRSLKATSLIWSRLSRSWSLWGSDEPLSTRPPCRVEEKTALSSAIFDRLDQICRAQDWTCLVVLFHRPVDIAEGDGWRGELVRGIESDVLSVLDSRDALDAHQEDWTTLYGEDRHPNAAGNRVLAEAVHAALGK